MKKSVIICLVFFILIFSSFAQAALEELLIIKLGYENGKVKLLNISKTTAYYFPTKNQPTESYNLNLFDKSGEIEFSENFNFPLDIAGTSQQVFDKGETWIYAPYSKKSEKVE